MRATTLSFLLVPCFAGCVISTPVGPECPDPADPRVHYISQEPDCYETIFWDGCSPTQTYIPTECGCGCVDGEEPVCPDPSDPDVHYIEGTHEDPTVCYRMDFLCEVGQTQFSNECGCGCIGPEERACPDPEAPFVHYISEDPAVCASIDWDGCDPDQTYIPQECGCGCVDCPDSEDPTVHYVDPDPTCATLEVPAFDCAPGQRYFEGGCGCGCIDSECPDPEDPAVHYIEGTHEDPTRCYLIDFGCGDEQTLFSNECGCGCIGPEEPTCPDPEDPTVHYIEGSHEDPTLCYLIDFRCGDEQTQFSNECGCGCIDAACEALDEAGCLARPDCAGCYVGDCDCTCPGPEGCEGGGCAECPPSCFGFVGCRQAG